MDEVGVVVPAATVKRIVAGEVGVAEGAADAGGDLAAKGGLKTVFFGAGVEGESGGGVVDVIIGSIEEVGAGEIGLVIDGEADDQAGGPVVVSSIEHGVGKGGGGGIGAVEHVVKVALEVDAGEGNPAHAGTGDMAGDVGGGQAVEVVGPGLDLRDLVGVACHEGDVVARAPGGFEVGLMGMEPLGQEEGGIAVAAGGIVRGRVGRVIVVVVAEFVGITGAQVEPAEWVPADTGAVLLNEPLIIG